MTKREILSEIKRTAAANGDAPLGVNRFEDETGIKPSDWLGIYWAKWGDAVREAGFAPNEMMSAYDESDLLSRFAKCVQELGLIPTRAQLMLQRRIDPEFPSFKTFERLGRKSELVEKVLEFCNQKPEFADVVSICNSYSQASGQARNESAVSTESTLGHVYLAKSGRFYKIGRSNSAGRREYELGIQLPERLRMIHVIRTDDPVGIERYWHERFADKRANGEWFTLGGSDKTASA